MSDVRTDGLKKSEDYTEDEQTKARQINLFLQGELILSPRRINFDQLHAYLEQHELYENEVRIMRECNQDPLALVANHQMIPSHVQAKEHAESLVNQLNQKKFKGKDIVDNVAQVSNDTTIALVMYKLDRVTLAPKDKNNRESHIYYLKNTIDQAAILREIVEQAKLLNPLDSASYSASSKDDAPDFIIKFLKMIQVRLNTPVGNIRTDNGTDFVNQTLRRYYESVGISHETLVARSPQQNGVAERRNRTLVEAAQTIKPDLSYLYVFGALCYPNNDSKDLGKLQAKANICIFIGYAPKKKVYRMYNRCTIKIIETIHVDIDELTAMASKQLGSGPGLQSMTPATSIPVADAPRAVDLADSPISTLIDQDAPSTNTPMVEKSKLDEDLQGKQVDATLYHGMIGSAYMPGKWVKIDKVDGFMFYMREKPSLIMTSKAQQIELDNALVAPENCRVISKCNMRINPGIKPKEPTFQVVLDALLLQHVILHSLSLLKSTCKAKKDVPSKKNPAFKPKPTKKKASVKADRGKGVLDKKHRKTSGADEGTGTKPGVPNVPKYDYENDKESWGDSEEEEEDDNDNDDDDNDGDDDDDDDKDANNQEDNEEKTDSDRTESDRIKIPVLNQSAIECYEEEEEKVDDEEDDEVTKELYKDVNVNLGNENADMTDADQAGACQRNVSQESGFHQVDEDAHVTLTPVLNTQKIDEPLQSSYVSSYFTSKILNLENPSLADNKIASLMDTTVRLEELGSQTSSLYTVPITAVPKITSIFTTTIPPPPHFFNPFPQQAPSNLTPTTFEATTYRC
nr:hypothetical protein [Tanacetum cinerariifolium]